MQECHADGDSGAIRSDWSDTPSRQGSGGPISRGVDTMNALKNFVVCEEGQDLVEYALLAALLSIVSIATLKILGPKIAAVWTTISNDL
jgi:pilus assembly protein Flp/PilA